MKKFLALAALLVGGVYLVQHQTTSPPPAAPPSPHTVETTALPWLQLRQRVKAYTGDNGGGDDFLTVCPTAALYKRWSSSLNAVIPQCNDKARGVPVTIGSDEIIPERDVTDQIIPGLYTVFIKADDGSWSGWTGSFGLQPRIPADTTVVVHLLAKSGTMSLFPNKTSTKGEITLYSGATLQILAQEPRTSRLYAQVIGNSPDVGKKGWIWPLGLDLPKGNSPLLFAPPPK